jgi:hypothetical protein
MACVWIPVQFLQVLDNTSTQRIKVQISNKLQKVWFFLTNYRLETVLKYMSMTSMPLVKVSGIPC